MKRSKSTVPSFADANTFLTHLGATRDVRKVLIANNGLAAVKGIRSLRSWFYDHVGDEEAVQLCVMASPEDLKANAEFVHMADQHVEVPGGSNVNNYANVDLIMSTATQQGCDAVYPGWGHASENPALPRECAKSKRVVFLGPSEKAMFALGDKIASTIIAQSNGVPTVPWSGDSIRLEPGTFEIDPATYEESYVRTAAECEDVCRRLGFPVMIKASEGGGGKGIRRVLCLEEVRGMFEAVQEEVKGCHIFVMRMLENVRHLEVQLLADAYGNCIAVRTRDCSVQRRHQKIIEEGPVVGVDQEMIDAMEAAAIRLALAVGYIGLGTVEYMYDKTLNTFAFLELNPRIQVEHPVSELISGVNLPAALLCVGMGIRLDRIPEVRSFYGEAPYDDTTIDFTTRVSLPPRCHAIAVRITAEDVDEAFRPTTGSIDEISFRNSKECWGYFSVSSGGAIHQFADSQFGHIFSTGETREDARRGMVLALRGICVRGEIRTSTAYVLELLERQEFRDCDVSTAWLDGLIARRMREKPNSQSIYPALLAAAVIRMKRFEDNNMDKYISFLQAGHTPSVDYLSNTLSETFVVHSQKYVVEVGKLNPNEYCVGLNGSVVTVPCRVLNTGGMQLTVSGRTVVAYGEEEPTSLRVTIQGRATTFTGDVDPTKLRSSVPGRLVRFLVPEGRFVQENAAYAEVEVMKMILPLRSAVSGTLQLRATAGCTVNIGRLLAEVVPEDSSKIKRPEDNTDPWPDSILHAPQRTDVAEQRLDAVQRARQALDALWSLMTGYHVPSLMDLRERTQRAISALPSIALSSVQLRLLNRPFLPESALDANTPVEKLKAACVCLVQEYLRVERRFDATPRQDAVALMRDEGIEPAAIFSIDFAHYHLHRHEVLRTLLEYLETNRMLMVACEDILHDLSSLQSSNYGLVLLKARYLLRQCSLPSFDERKADLARQLEQGSVETLMKGSYGFDLMCAVMFDQHAPHSAQLAVELFIRRAHFGVNLLDSIDIYSPTTSSVSSSSAWFASYHFTPLGEEHEPLVHHQPQSSDAASPARSFATDPTEGNGFVAVFNDDTQATELLPQFVETIGRDTAKGATAMASVFFAVRQDTTSAAMAETCCRLMGVVKDQALRHTSVALMTFLVHGVAGGPYIFTFRRSTGFEEDTLYRNVVPTSARRLELSRLQLYTLVMYPTPHRQVHVYYAQPIKRSGAVLPIEHRLFVRMFVSPRDLNVAPWSCISEVEASYAMSLCISAMEYARSDKKFAATSFNHLYINLIELSADASTMLPFFKKLADTYRKKLLSIGVREAEIKFKVKTDAGFVPFRVHILNHTGHAMLLRCYAETVRNGEVFLKRIENREDVDITSRHLRQPSLNESGLLSSTSGDEGSVGSPLRASGGGAMQLSRRDSLQCMVSETFRVAKTEEKLLALRRLLPPRTVEPFLVANDSFSRSTDPTAQTEAEHGEVHLGPYPILPPKQVKRLLANATRTTYVHDWMVIFEVALRQQWRELVEARGLPKDIVPPRLIQPSQLYVDKRTKQLTLQCTDTIPCGMVVWVVEYYPPSYLSMGNHEEEHPSPAAAPTAFSRRVVIAANDITFQSGSFAVPEDVAFKLASDLARSEGLPFVYLSANSGARLGLCTQVKDRFKVALSNDTIEYLYLTPEDYASLSNMNIELNVERLTVPPSSGADDAAVRYKILDIIGAPDEFLGVENLQGSALIAGHMSLNYATVPTISVATGRTVGIGAYLVRLGRRVVQTTSSPIILTGASALNRLLGKEVYSDNCQLGGHTIMVPNGVTHWEAKNDLAAVHTVLKWLNYVPEVVLPQQQQQRLGARLPWKRLTLPHEDPTDRDVTFTPGRDETYDPRCLVHGNPQQGTKGLFDEGSWMETLSGWAKTVVAGRATLGGIPCGVILVETRITKKFDPADPADPSSTSSFISQAGQVWFPDSARKTADALEDFHRERLPCFILANWRGFSGGMRDMYDEVLKFGASIVDNLRVYEAPVFIYIPPFGELRGGAWVVVDPVINHRGVVEMYADTTARGGILEPAGVVEIKFREADVRSLIRRNDSSVAAAVAANDTAEVRRLEGRLLPLYNDVAVQFADLHDTPGRMKAKNCIIDVVPWRDARRQFSLKLQRKLKEVHLAQGLVERGACASLVEALVLLADLLAEGTTGKQIKSDADVLRLLASAELPARIEAIATKKATDALRTTLLAATLNKDIAAALQDPDVRRALEAALNA